MDNGNGRIRSWFPPQFIAAEGVVPLVRGKFFGVFPALEDRNFRLYFAGQFVSLIGTWMQRLALGWLVFELTRSAFWVGTISALSGLPVLAFALIGGIVVDRFPRKTILILTEALSMACAAILGILAITEAVTILHIAMVAFILGTVDAFGMPARHALIGTMVEKTRLASAIALNSAVVNSSRVIGPSIGGILIASIGVGAAFLFNAATYIAVIISLLRITIRPHVMHEYPHALAAIREGLRYAWRHEGIKLLLLYTAIVTVFGWAFMAIMPVVVANVFHAGPEGLGYLSTAVGIGAVVSGILISALFHSIGNRTFIIGGNILLAVSLFVFSFMDHLYGGFVVLLVAGFALIGNFSVVNTTLQHAVADSFRGRVMAIYSASLRGMMPIGGFLIGSLADITNPQLAIRIFALVTLGAGILAFVKRNSIPQETRPSQP